MAGAEQDQHQQKGILQRISSDVKKDAMSPHAPADTSSPRKDPRPVAPNPALDKCNSYFKAKLGKEELGKVGGGTSSAASGIAADAKANQPPKPRLVGAVGMSVGVGMGKADKPMGAGQPNGPAKALAPKAPVPPSNAPAQAAAKQAQSQADASGTGGYKPPKTPGAVQPKNPTMQKNDYFRNKLSAPVAKSIKAHATEEQLYKSACPNCGVPEFKKDKDGNPVFNPCACFLVMKKDEEGKQYKFVQVLKKADGGFNLAFAKDADPEVVKLFLLTLKSALLIKRKFGVL
jgi:hypothetical protein